MCFRMELISTSQIQRDVMYATYVGHTMQGQVMWEGIRNTFIIKYAFLALCVRDRSAKKAIWHVILRQPIFHVWKLETYCGLYVFCRNRECRTFTAVSYFFSCSLMIFLMFCWIIFTRFTPYCWNTNKKLNW